MDFKENILSHFETLQESSQVSEAIYRIKTSAIQEFADLDVPTIKHEEWKYTNLKNLVSKTYSFPVASIADSSKYARFVNQYDEKEANILVFVNGVYVKELSHIISPESELQISNLSEAYLQSEDTMIANHFAKYAKFEKEIFVALNTALSQDGVFIHVPNHKEVQTPVILHFIADANATDVICHPRNLVIVGKNSSLTVIEHFSSTLTPFSTLTNAVTEVYVAPNAYCEHYKIQTEEENASHIGTTYAYVERDGRFNNTTVTLAGKIVRNNLNIKINGENCEAFMNGLYAVTGSTHVDNHSSVDHALPNSQSNQLYKGLLAEKSSGVFNGKIFVRQDAQKTNAYQSNKNILLAPTANVDTKPQLEIWANDVKCSHGCTVGALDEEPLFYLRSRGISQEQARAMLIFAFADDILERIKFQPVREFTEKIIAERFGMAD
ncbi:MAG: Fe-S cluster assembly protein SufD [Thermoflexibacter sp.]|nr:Fe-S cluster assembly protein SufD [Thermoflexibacter sp.]